VSLNKTTISVLREELNRAEECVSLYVSQRQNAERSLEQITDCLREATKRRDELEHSLEEES
jgi:hypothetical protein